LGCFVGVVLGGKCCKLFVFFEMFWLLFFFWVQFGWCWELLFWDLGVLCSLLVLELWVLIVEFVVVWVGVGWL